MNDTAHLITLGALPEAPLLLIATLSFAVSIAAVVYLAGMQLLTKKAATIGSVVAASEARLAANRDRMKNASATFRLGLALAPLVTPLADRLIKPEQRAELLEFYGRAGYPGGLDEDEVVAFAYMQAIGLGIGLAVVVSLAGLVFLGNPLTVVLGLVLLLAMVLLGPGLAKSNYQSTATKREKAIIRVFPYVVDLLVLTMKSGASLQLALQRVTVDYRGHPVAEEFNATIADIEMGSTARQGFENLARRVPIKIITAFVDDIVQSEELGQPVAEALERLSDRIRVRRIQDARATAGDAKVKVLVPSVLVMFSSLIMLMAPFVMSWQAGGFDTNAPQQDGPGGPPPEGEQ
ncbi:MAG: type II secretion system F family protein [Planctomycetota bacterium]